MNCIRLTCLALCLCCLTGSLQAQQAASPQDSMQVFYANLFTILKQDYFLKDSLTTTWAELDAGVKSRLALYPNFESSLVEADRLFDKISCIQCELLYRDVAYTAVQRGLWHQDFSTSWIAKSQSGPLFEASLLDGKYAYLLLPNIRYKPTVSAGMQSLSQPFYDKAVALAKIPDLKGVIIDLRFTTGHQPEVWLLALYPFLGDNAFLSVQTADNQPKTKFSFLKGQLLANGKSVGFVKNPFTLPATIKVAVITNLNTMQGGEAVALAFQNRPNTLFIGQKSFGFTQRTERLSLPFGAVLQLPTGRYTDRSGKYTKHILPQVEVHKLDKFNNLIEDKNVVEAIQWFNK